jgi:hydrogenase large subunit
MQSISFTPQSITLDPVSRIEGHLKVDVVIDTVNGRQVVVDAKTTGTMFRGIETILTNRSPLDAPDITQRICGVCPVSHALAASSALENAAGFTPPSNARVMRNLVLGANFLQSHILHFYVLSALDFVDGPAMPPWQPSWRADKRITGAGAQTLVSHYVKALEMRRKCHEMGALFGGKLPHPPAFVPGGFTTSLRKERIMQFRQYLAEVSDFIKNIYVPDVNQVGTVYRDYFQIGAGCKNLIAYGGFDLDDAGRTKLLRRGVAPSGSVKIIPLDINAITEKVTYSWYADTSDNLKPANGVTQPVYPKTAEAYSWLKAPRYLDDPFEAGPLARMWINGSYSNGISVIDRHLSRAEEAVKIADAMSLWVNELQEASPVYREYRVPLNASGIGLIEAPRGALGHWHRITSSKTGRYQIITPTCWNASPRDGRRVPGPIEQALLGTPVDNPDEPVEVLRVIHSFDPCLSCAVHVMRPAEGAKIFTVPNPASGS